MVENESPRRYSGNPLADLLAVCFVAFVLFSLGQVLLLRQQRPLGNDPNRLCVEKQQKVWTAVMQYVSDWDDRLPAMQNQAVFSRLMAGYISGDRMPTTCPATGKLYKPNPALGGVLFASIGNTHDTIELLRDSVAHTDRLTTVLFLDGHIERGGRAVIDGNTECVENVRKVVQAIKMYAQDYDSVLPRLSDPAEADDLLLPYTRSARQFRCAATNVPYVYNAAIGGKPDRLITDPSKTEVVKDDVPHADGKKTVAFFDGHVERGGKLADPPDVDIYCATRLKTLMVGIAMYTQDYDETFPGGAVSLPEQIGPYVRDTSIFVCPATQQNYDFNPALRGASLQVATDPRTTPVMQDHSPHASGARVVGFADWHVEVDGYPYDPNSNQPPDDDALSRAKQLALGMMMYVQDYDEMFPPMTDYNRFRDVLFPYVKNETFFVAPPQNLPWVLNQGLSMKPLVAIENPASTVAFRAPRKGRGGLIVKAYADGHVKRTVP